MIFTGFRSDPCKFAALMRQMVRKHPASFLKYIIRKPMVPMRRMFFVLFSQQFRELNSVSLIPIYLSLSRFPFVISGPVHIHDPAEEIYGILYFEFFDGLVVSSLPVTYFLLAPTPSTQYPFFKRAISTSCLATMRRSRSTSLSDLLVCRAAYGLPFRGSNASSPSSNTVSPMLILNRLKHDTPALFALETYVRPNEDEHTAASLLCSICDVVLLFFPR